ncbi:acyltransferase family protein [uncultured Treponema sp.]|uniref:acyltransferase family protein n=1 Tax=uncultured Treponema sp. TaxID=162155 RepID=UPI0025F70136|nr:acyltransferase family protein [uncultured Treponema sp.]
MLTRIKGIALPYYISWLFAFVCAHLPFGLKDFARDLSNSLYELLFIDMAGYKVGYYVNEPAWYVSALFMNILIFAPLAERFGKKYFERIAPVVALFLYGLLSLNTPNLYAPHTVMYGFIYKGMIRCAAGVNAGFAIYGLFKNGKFLEFIRQHKKTKIFIEFLSFTIIVAYMIFPIYKFEAARDYAVVILIFVFLTTILCSTSVLEKKLQKCPVVLWLGRFSVYLYFSQCIIYTHKELLHNWNISNFIKLPIWVVLCFSVAFAVYGFASLFKFIRKFVR